MVGVEFVWDPTLGIWLAIGTQSHTWKTSGSGYWDTATCWGNWEGGMAEGWEGTWWYEALPIAQDREVETEWWAEGIEGSGSWDYSANENITFEYTAEESVHALIVPVGVEWQPCWIPCLTLRLGATTRIETWDLKEVITVTDKPDTLEGTKTFSGECWYEEGTETEPDEEGSGSVDYVSEWNEDGSGMEQWTWTCTYDSETETVTETWEYDTEGNATVTIKEDGEIVEEYYFPNYCPVETETTVHTDTWKWHDTDTITTYSFGATYTPTENIVIDLMHFSNLTNMRKWILSVTFVFPRTDVPAHDATHGRD
jgi:hypothetical protein